MDSIHTMITPDNDTKTEVLKHWVVNSNLLSSVENFLIVPE